MAVWTAMDSNSDKMFVALFNLSDQPGMVTVSWEELYLESGTYTVTNLWTSQKTKHEGKLALELLPHGSFMGVVNR